MKKSLLSTLPTACGLLAGSMFLYFVILFLLLMTYAKKTINVAGTDYVRETTRWPGHKRSVYVPVYYPQDVLHERYLYSTRSYIIDIATIHSIIISNMERGLTYRKLSAVKRLHKLLINKKYMITREQATIAHLIYKVLDESGNAEECTIQDICICSSGKEDPNKEAYIHVSFDCLYSKDVQKIGEIFGDDDPAIIPDGEHIQLGINCEILDKILNQLV